MLDLGTSAPFFFRQAVVESLAQVAEKGNPDAFAAVSARLLDENWKVRQAAVEALAQIAEKGNPDAIAAASARL